ncbi:hypothetical protein GPJ56_008015 [Histomonas meleagridis]|uniref:uncharacterized protein n=1 Tax=Histomonas meleagridis TaxID=135588 RepID=UPI00355AB447|nr:hypothetical protein GPJ56_008015 [Histomonas meleagridis]KAH0803958.1 hypothetical protein GO595_002788 [Histomonas meleagridis]
MASKTDYSITQRSMVLNHAKAIRCSVSLNVSFGDVEIETVRLPNIHSIPDPLLPLNQKFENGEEFSIIPVLANDEKIIGFDIESTEYISYWKVKQVDNMHSFSMRIRPLKAFRLSYVVIETSSTDYLQALQIWQHSFNSVYQNEFIGSFVSYGSVPLQIIESFNQVFEIGNLTIANGIQYFQWIPGFSVNISAPPENLTDCEDEKCLYIKKYGRKNSKLEYIYSKINETFYSYEVSFVKDLFFNLSNQTLMETVYYNGFFSDKFDSTLVDYNIPTNAEFPFALLKDTTPYIPVMTSYFIFVVNNFEYSPNGYLMMGNWIHPQFANYCISFGFPIALCGEVFDYSNEKKNSIWKIRFQIGSKPISLIETATQNHVVNNYEQLFSVAMSVNAHVNTHNHIICGILAYNNDVISYNTAMRNIGSTIYYPRIREFYTILFNMSEQIPPMTDLEHDYFGLSMYCKETDQDNPQEVCYLNVLVSVHKYNSSETVTFRHINLTFSSGLVPTCFQVSQGINCTTYQTSVNIELSVNEIRTATIQIETEIEEDLSSWVSENIPLVIIASVPIIALLVGMGFGLWFMFCKKRSSKEALARIVKTAKRRKKEKTEKEKNLLT